MIAPNVLAVVVLLVVAVAVACSAQLDRIHVRTSDRQFVDEHGRVRIFHGINDVNKASPYLSSFTADEVDRFARVWGFNLLRLGFSWEGYEPVRGQRDPGYMASLSDTVTQLAQAGVWSIVDVHQDLYSRVYCGNGFPAWTVHVAPSVMAHAPFPIPVLGRDVSYVPQEDGTISGADCGRSYWGTYYFSNVTGSMFDSFYADHDGIQTDFVSVWADIAGAFVDRTEVFGYEIINEPFPGNIYDDPRLLLNSTTADIELLAPLYARCNDAIRAIDNDTIIVFEPLVSNSEILPRKSGFQHGPSGPDSLYRDREAYAFHWYCMPIEGRPDYCQNLLDASFWQRERDAERMGVAKLITEFGFFAGTDADRAAETTWFLDKADTHLISWTNWEYKVIKDNPESQKALARTYAQAVAGTPVSQTFDAATDLYTFQYRIDPAIDAPTEIFVAATLRYPNGFDVTIEPETAAEWYSAQPHLVFVEATARALPHQLVTVTISAK